MHCEKLMTKAFLSRPVLGTILTAVMVTGCADDARPGDGRESDRATVSQHLRAPQILHERDRRMHCEKLMTKAFLSGPVLGTILTAVMVTGCADDARPGDGRESDRATVSQGISEREGGDSGGEHSRHRSGIGHHSSYSGCPLLQAHGGTITVTSDGLGQGVTATIRLPQTPGEGP